MKTFNLFIDELGVSSPFDKQSEIYVLCGCAIDELSREELKIESDQIKFKYWNHTNIIFHSREIGKSIGDFRIFNNSPEIKNKFYDDLFKLLNKANITIFPCTINKKGAAKIGWNSIKIEKESARKLFYHFLVWLLGLNNCRGKVTIEMATAEKDRYYLQEFAYFLSPQCKELTVDYRNIQKIFTSISFVTKRNNDIEQQIADIFSYAIRCKYFRLMKIQDYKPKTYEDEIIRILDRKLFKKPKIANTKKMKFYEVIDPFCILPSK